MTKDASLGLLVDSCVQDGGSANSGVHHHRQKLQVLMGIITLEMPVLSTVLDVKIVLWVKWATHAALTAVETGSSYGVGDPDSA